MTQEAVVHRDHGKDTSSTGGEEVDISEKELRRLGKEEKNSKKERERAEKTAQKEHERLEKLAKQREKEELKAAKKNGLPKNNNGTIQIEQTPPSPGYLDEEDENSMDRSPAVSPIGGKTSTIPATYQHITEEISAQGAGPGIYASNTMKSNFSVNTNGRQKEVVVPVIPAERTATPTGQSKSGGQSKATVRLLSDQDAEFHIPKNANGQYLFDRVCELINLQEKDYFGIRFMDTDGEKSWMNMDKTVKEQAKSNPWTFEFLVKFYPPQPTELKEDLTRYYLCMQIHRDLITERLPASFTTYAILGSLMVQSELGDYDRSRHIGNYVSEVPLAPPNKQNAELEEKVMELHRENTRSMSDTEADIRYLENAKRLAFYAMDLHRAKDKEEAEIKVGVSGAGIDVYRDNLRINRFAWPKILKISYRRNTFYIKIRPQEVGKREEEIAFCCPYQKATKRLWKVCVEHHKFFRHKGSDEPDKTLRWPRPGRTNRQGSSTMESQESEEVRHAKIDAYIDQAVSFHTWMTLTISRFQEHDKFSSVRQAQSLLAESALFRSLELPRKLDLKDQLSELYNELQILDIDVQTIPVKEEIQPVSLDKLWRMVLAAIEYSENSLQDDLQRFETLQSKAEATCHSVLIIDARLNKIKNQMKQDEHKIRTLKNQDEANSICNNYKAELIEIDQSIKSAMTDAEMLREESYHDHETIYRSVLEVEQKYITVWNTYHERIFAVIAAFHLSTSTSHVTLEVSHENGGGRVLEIQLDVNQELSAREDCSFDEDKALREAILKVTKLNPDLEVEKLEV